MGKKIVHARKLKPYLPLMTFGLAALALFASTQILRSVVCDMIAKSGPCTFTVPSLVPYMPVGFLLLGVIGTVWNLARRL